MLNKLTDQWSEAPSIGSKDPWRRLLKPDWGNALLVSLAKPRKEYGTLLSLTQPWTSTCLLRGEPYCLCLTWKCDAHFSALLHIGDCDTQSMMLTWCCGSTGASCSEPLLLVARSWIDSSGQEKSVKERRCCSAECRAAVFSSDFRRAVREWSGKKLCFL